MDQTPNSPASAPTSGSGGVVAEPRRLWFAVSPVVVLRVGLPLAVLLCVVSYAGRVVASRTDVQGTALFLLDTLDVDGEGGFPAWISSMVLLACAASLWTVAGEVSVRGQRWSRHWRLIALVFVALSLDELVSLHERTNAPVNEALDLGGAFFFGWIVVAIPLLAVFALVLLPYLRALPRWTRLAFVVSGAVYVGGAVGMEMVGGMLADGGADPVVYHLAATFEEMFEMVGLTLFLASINEHRRQHLGTPWNSGAPTAVAPSAGPSAASSATPGRARS